MDTALWHGSLVRLAAQDQDTDPETYARWSRDSEFQRLLDSDPARPRRARWFKDLIAEDQPRDAYIGFQIRSLAGDRLIGICGLGYVQWAHGNAFAGIGLGEREAWGQGYGTDAMRVLLRYAFAELNLHRVSLEVYAYNPRAIRSYEKVGFRHEGRLRQSLRREGRRWDAIGMGILRKEWEAAGRGASAN